MSQGSQLATIFTQLDIVRTNGKHKTLELLIFTGLTCKTE